MSLTQLELSSQSISNEKQGQSNVDIEGSNPEVETEGDVVEAIPEFDQMGLKTELLRGIYTYGYEKPSVIQQRAIVPLLKGRDIIAQSQSGTGKTATFSLGMLQQIDPDLPEVQSLILAPTRELARQTDKVVNCLGMHLKVKTFACVGGGKVTEDIDALQNGVQVVTGTPGRVLHMIEEKILRTDHVKVFILDEADEMLSEGFEQNIRDILSTLPNEVQVGVFSATMPEESLQIMNRFMRDPVKVLVKKEQVTLRGINQFYVNCQEQRNKYAVLCDLYADFSIQQAVIFCNSRRTVDWLTDMMRKDKFTVAATHGSIHPEDRKTVMEEFRKGGSRVLITTDLLSRGIDVAQVSVVINYDLPKEKESYIHRIGRSGRFGKKGLAINFVTKRDEGVMKEIERFYDTQIDPLPKNVHDYV